MSVFIELTDHLRCTAPHPEQFLVLLPDRLDERRVVSGELGCPVCGRVIRLADGEADFGDGTPSGGETALTAVAIESFLGLSGPGGYIALVGSATSLAGMVGGLLPGVRLVLVNPAPGIPDSATASVLRAGRLPLKTASMRGIVVGEDAADDPIWVGDSANAVLPGLRIVVAGGTPVPPTGVEVLAEGAGCWVGRRR